MRKKGRKIIIDVRKIQDGYGEMKVISDININVKEEEIVEMVGRKGDGKKKFMREIYNMIN